MTGGDTASGGGTAPDSGDTASDADASQGGSDADASVPAPDSSARTDAGTENTGDPDPENTGDPDPGITDPAPTGPGNADDVATVAIRRDPDSAREARPDVPAGDGSPTPEADAQVHGRHEAVGSPATVDTRSGGTSAETGEDAPTVVTRRERDPGRVQARAAADPAAAEPSPAAPVPESPVPESPAPESPVPGDPASRDSASRDSASGDRVAAEPGAVPRDDRAGGGPGDDGRPDETDGRAGGSMRGGPAGVRRGGSRAVFGAVAFVLLAVLGVLIATQVRTVESGDALDAARPADLLVVLDNLNQREASLRQEITDQQQTLRDLEGQDPGAALDEARRRLDELETLIGGVPVTGSGVTVEVTDPHGGVETEVIVDLVQELRAAGARAIEIGGATGGPVRVGVETAVTGEAGAIEVDHTAMTAPYRVVAIGDGPTLSAALNIPGGVVDSVARAGGVASVTPSPELTVSALREIPPRQYSQPGN